MRTRATAAPILAIFAVLLCTQSCDQDKVRKEAWKWKNKAGKALVEVNATWETFYAFRADEIGDKVIKDNPGLSEDELVAKFEIALKDLDAHDARYQKAKVSTAEALEACEEALDAWEHVKDPDASIRSKVLNASRDVARGLEDIMTILIECGVKVPPILDTCVTGLGNLLDLLADEPDPDTR
jgi:hypothetical protein